MLNASLFDNNESDSKNEIVLASHSFEVVGNKYLKKSAIYDALGVDNKSFYEFWKEDNPRIKDKLIPILSTSIRAFLDSEGFYDATFKIEKTTQNLKVIVEENKPIKNIPNLAGKKMGRNEPCFCGSGKKYKQCCGKSGPKKGAFAS